MTQMTETPRRMGRKKLFHEKRLVKFREGTGERIDAVLEERNGRREDRTDFIRLAVERELERRERTPKPKRRKRSD
jgi:hypothetical protein